MATKATYGRDEFNHACDKIGEESIDSVSVKCRNCASISTVPKTLISDRYTSYPTYWATLKCCSLELPTKGATQPSNMSKK